MFFEEVGRYYLPWIVAAAAVAVIPLQQHTTMELIERINARYLQQLATVMEALERVNMTLETEGYTLLPLERLKLPLRDAAHASTALARPRQG